MKKLEIKMPDDWNATVREAAEQLARESGGDVDEIETVMLVIAAFPAAINTARAKQEAAKGRS